MNNKIHNYSDIPDEIELEDEFKNIFNKMEYSNQNIFQQFSWVVLHPTGPRQDLVVLELMTGHLGAVVIEDHAAGTGGALVDGADELRGGHGHGRVSDERFNTF